MAINTDIGSQNPKDSRKWIEQPTGQFSGIDYSGNGAADGLDSYFVWADVNGFAHLRTYKQKPGSTDHIPKSLPVLVKLAKGVSPLQLATPDRLRYLQVPEAYLEDDESYTGGLIPATVKPDFFKELRANGGAVSPLSSLVQRVEMDLPQNLPLVSEPTRDPAEEPTANAKTAVAQSSMSSAPSSVAPTQNIATGEALEEFATSPVENKVIAFIDDGCAFAHPHFLTGDPNLPSTWRTRVVRLWDMNEANSTVFPSPPSGYTEGREYTDAQLNAFIQARICNGRLDEAGVYADLAAATANNVNRLLRRYAHGSGVMQLACGPYFAEDLMCTRENAPSGNPSWAKDGDAASEAQMIFVQLPMRTVQDTTLRGTMQQDVLNGLQYIIHASPPDAQIVVNLSWGTLAGSHTGTNLLEQEIDRLISLSAGRLQVVVPAGNGYQSRTHANFKLDPAGSVRDTQPLYWRTIPDDSTESYLEIWLEDGAEVEIDVYTPSGQKLSTVKDGDVEFLDYENTFSANVVLGVCYNRLLQGPMGVGPGIVLALAPTADIAGLRKTSEHGVWKVMVRNVSTKSTVVDAYIERDDDAAGTRSGSRQSYLDSLEYDRQAVDDDHQVTDFSNPTSINCVVRREGVYNSIATGTQTQVVGGVRQCDMQVAEYSPHDMYSNRPKRPGTPEHAQRRIWYTLTEESKTLHGIRIPGPLGGGTVRLSGTSNAAPQIVRDLFNVL